jgi:hypothetical protein
MIGGQAIPDAAKKRVSDQPQKSRSGGSGYLSLKWPMPANCPEINPAATAKIFLILSNSGSRHFRRSGRFRHRSSVLIDRLDFTASKAVDIERGSSRCCAKTSRCARSRAPARQPRETRAQRENRSRRRAYSPPVPNPGPRTTQIYRALPSGLGYIAVAANKAVLGEEGDER